MTNKEISKLENKRVAAISPELEDKFTKTSENLDKLIDMGNVGLGVALEILCATEGTPRTIESFATLLKAVSDLNMRQLEVHKTKSNMVNGTSESSNITDNAKVIHATQNIFNGSTQELSKLVAEMSAKKD